MTDRLRESIRRRWGRAVCRALLPALATSWLGGTCRAQLSLPAAPAPPRQTSFAIRPFSAGKTTINYAVADVLLEGKKVGHFVVDTGSSQCAVTDTLAASLALRSQPALSGGRPITEGKGGPPLRYVSAAFALGTFRFVNSPLVVLPRGRLAGIARGFSPDGIIGMNLLSLFAVLFDYGRHTVTLMTAGVPAPAGAPGYSPTPDDLRAVGFDGAAIVPLVSWDPGRWGVEAQVAAGGASATQELLVDTGSDRTMLPHALAQALGLRLTGRPGPGKVVTGGAYRQVEAQVSSLTLGGRRLTDVPVSVLASDADDRAMDPVLGVDVLSRFRVLFDFAGRRMYLAPLSPPGPEAGPAPSSPASVHGP